MSRRSTSTRTIAGSARSAARNASIRRRAAPATRRSTGTAPSASSARICSPRAGPQLAAAPRSTRRVRRQQRGVLAWPKPPATAVDALGAELLVSVSSRQAAALCSASGIAARPAAACLRPGVGGVPGQLGVDLGVAGPAGRGQPPQQRPAQLGVDGQARRPPSLPSSSPAEEVQLLRRARGPGRAAAPRPAGGRCPARPRAAARSAAVGQLPLARRHPGRVGDDRASAAAAVMCRICSTETDRLLAHAARQDPARRPAPTARPAAPCPAPRSSRQRPRAASR